LPKPPGGLPYWRRCPRSHTFRLSNCHRAARPNWGLPRLYPITNRFGELSGSLRPPTCICKLCPMQVRRP
jgi:hypothetical protein